MKYFGDTFLSYSINQNDYEMRCVFLSVPKMGAQPDIIHPKRKRKLCSVQFTKEEEKKVIGLPRSFTYHRSRMRHLTRSVTMICAKTVTKTDQQYGARNLQEDNHLTETNSRLHSPGNQHLLYFPVEMRLLHFVNNGAACPIPVCSHDDELDVSYFSYHVVFP